MLTMCKGSGRMCDMVVKTVFESNIGIRAQVVGLAIAVLSSVTGTFGTLGSMLGTCSMHLLLKELRSFATLQGLKWAATNLQGLWLSFVSACENVKVGFLYHLIGHRCGSQMSKVNDEERMQWASQCMEKVAAKIPQLPVEALAPELAIVLKDWETKLQPPNTNLEALDEWIEIDTIGLDSQSFFVDEKN